MNEATYNGLSDAAKAAIDPAALSKSAEDAWNATSDDGLAKARATGDNTFIDLTEEEVSAFATAVADVVNAYVEEVNGAAALEAMRSSGG